MNNYTIIQGLYKPFLIHNLTKINAYKMYPVMENDALFLNKKGIFPERKDFLTG
jgi:hypothetical protein